MRVVNIHRRKLEQPIEKVSFLFNTLATNKDMIWPFENWPAISFKEGLKVGNRGGHGIVRYTIIAYKKGKSITFSFTKPDGFIGTHELRIQAISENETEIIHEIKMETATLKASVLWFFVINWLHDALIEEAFDKLENNLSQKMIITKYNPWVKLLRNRYKKKSLQIKHA